MKTVLYIFLLTGLSLSNTAHADHLSPQAQLLFDIYKKLEEQPDNDILQQQYLLHFPHTQADFDSLFDAADFSELYDGYEYISKFKTLMPAFPILTGCIILDIAKDSHWQPDAFNYLQQITTFYALQFTADFVSIFKTYSVDDQNSVIEFLADGDSGPVKTFSDIVKKLVEADEEELANQFMSIERRVQELRDAAGN